MSLSGIAKETLAVVERGHYVTNAGKSVEIRALVDASVKGTMLFTPSDVERIVASASAPTRAASEPGTASQSAATAPSEAGTSRMRIEVVAETTSQAARRLVQRERFDDVMALNYASAKNPGGGFLGGAKAQEEDLCRCSALYTTQLTQREYYDANRALSSMLYTDHLIYSPRVPFFRDDDLELVDEPFCVSVITSPAPNAGQALRRDAAAGPAIHEALVRRAGHVLGVAADRGHRVLVLGAWGCGVFRNDPVDVADVFGEWLASPRFANAFDRIVFAIPHARGRSADRNYDAFAARFASL